MSDALPPNSHRSKTGPPKPQAKKIERVTSGEAVQRKRGLGTKFKDTFIGGDFKSAAALAVGGVVVPAIQEMVGEFFHTMIDNVIQGERRPQRRPPSAHPGSGYGNVGHFNYQGITSGPPKPQSGPGPTQQTNGRMLSREARTRHDFGDIVIQDRREATEVLERLYDLLSRYGSASVSDLYELTGIQSSHTDHKWGWISLTGSRVAPLRGGNGYVLNLPDPIVFD